VSVGLWWVGGKESGVGGRFEKVVEESLAHRFSTRLFANARRVKQSGFSEGRRFIGFSGRP
jgi:hypothetical protein